MAPIDWLIVCILIVSVVSAFRRGLCVSLCSLLGLVLGLMLASWNYQLLVPWVRKLVQNEGVDEALSFIAIAIAVMVLAGLLGRLLRWAFHWIGLGWADRLMGACFGLLQGCVLVTLGVMAVAAFLPHLKWLEESRTASYFLSMAHHFAVITPAELADRIRAGIKVIEQAQPDWLRHKV